MRFSFSYQYSFLLLVALLLPDLLMAATARYRLSWREDPATSMVIGWDQVSGESASVYVDVIPHGTQHDRYKMVIPASHKVQEKGMYNHFARLRGLQPNTTYYFLICDADGCSPPMQFQTVPNVETERLSIIAGGDSRNHRDARQAANRLVSKLRPHFVLFGGDMTSGDTPEEWINWFDDWQLTQAVDGMLTPIVVARGNHEANNSALVNLFDLPNDNAYYAHSFGGNLLRVYTLNSMVAPAGKQSSWLNQDLSTHRHVRWKIGQYHIATRPHTRRKAEKNDQLLAWSTLFAKYGVNLVIESDAHVVKQTYPIVPSRDRGSEEGFIRDDARGTVYVGEGCWGAPLRTPDDAKSWTRASGSFNQFKWIFVSNESMEIRTVKIGKSDHIKPVTLQNRFAIPPGLPIWKPDNGSGEVLKIAARKDPIQSTNNHAKITSTNRPYEEVISDFKAEPTGLDVRVSWRLEYQPEQYFFVVQRSMDGHNFTTIGKIYGIAEREKYEYLDKDASRKFQGKYVSYRVKKVLHQ